MARDTVPQHYAYATSNLELSTTWSCRAGSSIESLYNDHGVPSLGDRRITVGVRLRCERVYGGFMHFIAVRLHDVTDC
jgi:hypothetical protein